MKKKVLLLTFGAVLFVGCGKDAAKNEVPDLNAPVTTVITIDEAQTYQSIDGFGASLTDSSAWLLACAMTPAQRQAVLEELFDPEKGIGLSYLRQPMGTSDFRVSSSIGGHDDYTYDDMPLGQSDYELSHFSIAKDEKYIIPVLQEIVAISPEVKLMGSPWSAPHWMKQGENLGGGRLKDDVYDTYAHYFVKYIQAYAEHGLTLNAITLQNEPWFEPGSYHGTRMEPTDQIKLVKKMGPLFAANGLDTEILVWDHNWDQPQYPIEILSDAEAKKYVAGTAWHHYYGDVSSQTVVHNAHPDRDTHFTEGSNGSWQKPGFGRNFIRTTREMIGVLRNWSKSFITWNLALDTENGPKIPGGCDTCYGVITIDQADGSFSRRPQYYTFGHSSKFVRPGAYRIDSADSGAVDIENVAFKNHDGSRVVIALNSESSAQMIRVNCNGQSFKYLMPARAVATFVWDDQPDSSVQVWLTTGDQTKLLSREADVVFVACNKEAVTDIKEAEVQYLRITAEDYISKMKAGWIGQMAGVGWAAPTEFNYLERTIPDDEVPEWKPEMINQFNQDDIYVEMTFLRTLELYGFDVSYEQAGIDFANSEYQLWHANKFGRDNLRKGIAPPDSGHPKFTQHSDDIDYQIEADYAGLIAPGMPNIAIELGEKFGRMMNYGDGLYAGQFVSGMYAAAFFETDIETIINAGLACIPKKSHYARMVNDVINWYKENPDDWVKSWQKIEAKYQKNPEFRKYACDGPTHIANIDAKINGAYIVMGLLYGQGDPDKTMIVSMRCGQDSDCNPSSAAGILFTSMGTEQVPERFTSALDPEDTFSHTPYTFDKLVQVCQKLARVAVVRSGGRVEMDATGKEVFVIPVKRAVPGQLQKSWLPGPTANSTFSKEQMAQIHARPHLTAQQGLDLFAPGWKVTNCGDSLEPGLHSHLRGKGNVFATHPALDKTDCVLSKEVAVPDGNHTQLNLTVGHHENGDWELIIKANGKELKRVLIGDDGDENGWEDVTADLSEYAGKTIELELINHANDWNHEAAYWAKIEIVSQ